jgi:hypothetical protein
MSNLCTVLYFWEDRPAIPWHFDAAWNFQEFLAVILVILDCARAERPTSPAHGPRRTFALSFCNKVRRGRAVPGDADSREQAIEQTGAGVGAPRLA